MSVRQPAVAGSFYPAQPQQLTKTIEECFLHPKGPGSLPGPSQDKTDLKALICPHAGYVYSGPAAAHGYLELSKQKPPEIVVILCPNHTGWGSPVSMYGRGVWRTPLGDVPVDKELAEAVFRESGFIDMDESAHVREHSIEVQLPFLQYTLGEFKILPICMGHQDLETSRHVAKAIVNVSGAKEVMFLASTDLTHQESQGSANRKDRMVIDAILELDEEKLQRVVKANRISTCGYGPVSVALAAAKLRGANHAELLTYYTSGDIIGDHTAVVGYAAAKITAR